MKRVSLLALAGLALAGCADRDPVAVSRAPQAAVVATSGRYVVALNNSAKLTETVAALGGRVDFLHTGAGIAVVSGLTPAAAASLSKASGIKQIEQDARFLVAPAAKTVARPLNQAGISSVGQPQTAILRAFQWDMDAIGANKAWAAGKLGSPDVTVAILDTGVDYDSFDLIGQVDLARSKSFIPEDTVYNNLRPGRELFADFNGHGTNVAQTVSSRAFAFAGVTSRTKIMAVKVLAGNGFGDLSAILSGVLYAADNGADVANMSLGGAFSKAGNGRYVGLINQVFNYAHSKGMLIVVSAGNDSWDLDHDGNTYSTYCNAQHVICVSALGKPTATGSADAVSFYTNFGRSSITVGAPGGNASFDANGDIVVSNWVWGADIASWVWSMCSKDAGTYDAETHEFTGGFPCAAGNFTQGYIGTSQAAPHVSGLAALLIAERGKGNPQAIKQAILQSADDLGQPGTDPFYGKGRINVARALGL